jgi:lambda repressor-like predicted transcriptional regulator
MENMVFSAEHEPGKSRRIPVYFEPQHRDLAQLTHESLETITRFIRETWGFEIPEDFRIYVMNSMMQLIFHPSPLHRKILLGLFLPLWYRRVKKIWEFSGGWSYPTGKRMIIGVKPPELWPDPEKNFGMKVFVDEPDERQKFLWFLCHESVHAFSYHLRLPLWLNEGLATLSVDRLYQKQTIRPQTLEVLEKNNEADGNMNYRKVQSKDNRTLLYHFLRGYWLTRYLEERRPGVLKEVLARKTSHPEIAAKVAKALDLPVEELWRQADGILTEHFRETYPSR